MNETSRVPPYPMELNTGRTILFHPDDTPCSVHAMLRWPRQTPKMRRPAGAYALGTGFARHPRMPAGPAAIMEEFDA